MFHVYITIIWPLYIEINDHYQKYTCHSSLYSWFSSRFVYPLAPFPVVIANCSLYLWVHFVLLCLLICFFFFVSSYEWNNVVFVFLHLIYFIQHNSVKVHQCCKCQNFILFYGWLVFIVFIYKTSFLSIYSLTGT